MNAVVCMPWRPTEDRVAAKHRVCEFWEHHGFTITVADSPGAKFNLAQARNIAAHVACYGENTDVLIVADADTIPDIACVHRAIAKARRERVVIWPFTEYRHIPGACVDSPDLLAAPVTQRYTRSVGGLFVLRKELYWELGGNDERFVGWGYEDSAFHTVAVTLAKVRRENGIVFSFDHQADRNLTPSNPNRELYQQYRKAMFKSAKMRELIESANAVRQNGSRTHL